MAAAHRYAQGDKNEKNRMAKKVFEHFQNRYPIPFIVNKVITQIIKEEKKIPMAFAIKALRLSIRNR